ncbi:ABC transporter ATP-binding protein [Salipaludibacillus agaradhaerens]|uniref:ABC transporter ATP-binding protein n=1 Tax=Salipaludibacillus agaradhaerens TaxID=76935 RepID=A0A9Q4B293_SALAG|nr:ABC transporter ATP-binding protein [Salipaludibacillus agaradhaerens]MCR6097011.1 ABC transporter ATP-binding protein [Salipaludibacillus agaradhaerens]MCR6113504.1 ABC transporter ATP-binding protein [Salipaludibacillus agaradhaerens]
MSELLAVNNVTGGYHKNKPVLHDITFTVEPNEMVGLIGLNGAGKSTTIKHILGLMEPHKGEVRLAGKTLAENKTTYRQKLAYIPETPLLYEEMTLWEHLELTAMAYGLTEKQFKERADKLLKEFRMTKMINWFPSHFSKGMRQKVMIMSAFLIRPSMYIADEPFVGLDPIGIKSFLDRMLELREEGCGILMSTHILATAEKYCDRFLFLHQGQLIMQGTLKELQMQANMPNAALDDIYVEMTKEDQP